MTRAAQRLFTLALVLVVLALPVAGVAQKALRPYTLIFDFVPTGEYVPHYTALEKGWYRDEGLGAAGQGEVGISDISALIAARANTHVKVKAIALWYRRPPHGIFVRAEEIYTNDLLPEKK